MNALLFSLLLVLGSQSSVSANVAHTPKAIASIQTKQAPPAFNLVSDNALFEKILRNSAMIGYVELVHEIHPSNQTMDLLIEDMQKKNERLIQQLESHSTKKDASKRRSLS